MHSHYRTVVIRIGYELHKLYPSSTDIKPANVFLTLDLTVKLGDLGLGRFFSRYNEFGWE